MLQDDTWLQGGKKALQSIWDEYRHIPIDVNIDVVSGSKRPRSPTENERHWNMALIYGDDDGVDELET